MLIRITEGTEDWVDSGLAELFQRAGDVLLRKEGLGLGSEAAMTGVEVDLTFVDEDEIRELNREHRGKDSVTDVLSFPMFEEKGDVEFAAKHGMEEIILGDVVICLPVLKRQAAEYGHSEEREAAYLFVHSLLHLLGYDHEDAEGNKEMRAVEEEVMAELGLERS
jgi:probable rRNA maturation factor